jgi:hypothetical protein
MGGGGGADGDGHFLLCSEGVADERELGFATDLGGHCDERALQELGLQELGGDMGSHLAHDVNVVAAAGRERKGVRRGPRGDEGGCRTMS